MFRQTPFMRLLVRTVRVQFWIWMLLRRRLLRRSVLSDADANCSSIARAVGIAVADAASDYTADSTSHSVIVTYFAANLLPGRACSVVRPVLRRRASFLQLMDTLVRMR